MSDEFAPGSGGSAPTNDGTVNDAGSGAPAGSGQGYEDPQEAADRNLPFNKHPRWQQVYGEAKEYRSVKPQLERWKASAAEWEQWQQGSHPGVQRFTVEKWQERDGHWQQWVKDSGAEPLLKAYFAKMQGGGQATQTEGQDAPWKGEISKVEQRIAQFEQAQIRGRLENECDAAIKTVAPYYAAHKGAHDWISNRAAELAAEDMRPGTNQLAKPMAEYVKAAAGELDGISKARAAGVRPAQPASPSLPNGGIPPGMTREQAYEARKRQWIQEQEARIRAEGGG